MKIRITVSVLLFAMVAQSADAQNRTHRRRGALLGGLAGAAIGVAIGDKGNNETAGALIGGAVGAVAGGAIGDAKDQRIEHNHRYHSGHHSDHHIYREYKPYYGPQPVYPQPVYPQPIYSPSIVVPHVAVPHGPQPMGTQDVLGMLHSGLSENIIVQQLQHRGMDHEVSVAEIIELHNLGVSERILQAMQGLPYPR
ncbi:glycine zipper domain-containing protein [Rubripirellula amarantea]|nr:glycine zipper domain-containing protein [Rubripirellula amarantea]